MSHQDELIERYHQTREDLRKQELQEMEDRAREQYEIDKAIAQSKICKRFFDSEIGRFLHDEAIKHESDAKDRLAALRLDSYPNRDAFISAIQELQAEIHSLALMFTWIAGAIQKAEELELSIE